MTPWYRVLVSPGSTAGGSTFAREGRDRVAGRRRSR
jgi:hypothetical protein